MTWRTSLSQLNLVSSIWTVVTSAIFQGSFAQIMYQLYQLTEYMKNKAVSENSISTDLNVFADVLF